MKKIYILLFFVQSFCCTFYAQNLGNAPRVYTDNFKTLIKSGEVFDCTKDNLGVSVKFSKEMLKYDAISVRLYLNDTYLGKTDPRLLAYKDFLPQSKEFSIKYANQDSVKINFMEQNAAADGIDRTNNIMSSFKGYFCPKHYDNDYFFVITGFIKTGQHEIYNNGNVIMKDEFDNGTEISKQSTHFKGAEK